MVNYIIWLHSKLINGNILAYLLEHVGNWLSSAIIMKILTADWPIVTDQSESSIFKLATWRVNNFLRL